ncbi:hypothetical protein L226DRAFT_286206 [Lentinus tigrinus ALCF2SS1-7]|uniref:uncharacterized protein n=1 Tax=Lentinus tigrinus ALCF2SS1-7 TaxID=1328758 RepID=UPI0011663C2D|nr:hypothetical protein L226DRAFT_286206 [Lentinus tigrinus ALCF2SS1-7]
MRRAAVAPRAASLLASLPAGRGRETRLHVHPLWAHSCIIMHLDSRSFAYYQSRQSRPCRHVVSLRSPPLLRTPSLSRSSVRYVPMPPSQQPTVHIDDSSSIIDDHRQQPGFYIFASHIHIALSCIESKVLVLLAFRAPSPQGPYARR